MAQPGNRSIRNSNATQRRLIRELTLHMPPMERHQGIDRFSSQQLYHFTLVKTTGLKDSAIKWSCQAEIAAGSHQMVAYKHYTRSKSWLSLRPWLVLPDLESDLPSDLQSDHREADHSSTSCNASLIASMHQMGRPLPTVVTSNASLIASMYRMPDEPCDSAPSEPCTAVSSVACLLHFLRRFELSTWHLFSAPSDRAWLYEPYGYQYRRLVLWTLRRGEVFLASMTPAQAML